MRLAFRSSMRGILLAGIIIFSGFALCAQTAPDIARGTSGDAVIRLYGWPKGKSTTEGREIWVFDHFHVMFENGRVVSVSPSLEGKNQPKRSVAPVRSPATQPNRSLPSPTNAGRQIPAASNPSRQGPANPSVSPAASPSTRRTPERPAVPKRTAAPATGISIWINLVWVACAAVAVGIGGLIFAKFTEHERKEEAEREAAAQRRRQATRDQKTWQDAVAEQLAKRRGDAVPRPAAGESVAPLVDLTAELLRRLEWKRFEQVVALYYEATGVRADCTCIGPDGGIDVKLFRPGCEQPFSYIQCKAWGSEKVPLTKLREFLGVMAADRITEGVFITTSDFWPEARAFAESNNIAALTTADFVRSFQELPLEARTRILSTVTTGDYTTPTCPQCDSKMVWKENGAFWGCPRYPRCRSKPIYARAG